MLEETKARDQGEVAPVIRQQRQVVFKGRRGYEEIHAANLLTREPSKAPSESSKVLYDGNGQGK